MSSQPSSFSPIGVGTWKLPDSDECAAIVTKALELGYRHIDTAHLYDTEQAVGRGIRHSSVDRDDIVLASKVWIDRLSFDDVIASTAESLDRLGTDYIDLLYVHWPAGEYEAASTLDAFADLRQDGHINHIGVSNFTPSLLEEAQSVCSAPIIANQIEMHPLLQQAELREYCRNNDISLVAYSPFIHGEVFELPILQEIAENRNASVAQVTLAWFRTTGVTPIPKASSDAHLRDNWASRNLSLSYAELAQIEGLERERRISDGDIASAWE